ncbi:MAG: nucleotidyl transferase AbiEii/AbiGii toxin family protein [Polyangiales bacterium]
MAERPENQRALALLERLDAALLRVCECWFAGGSAISLRCGEFRVSRDVDFLCASREGYRELRERVNASGGAALFCHPLVLVRPARVDRYGIRMAVELDGEPLKLEIVSEGRIDLVGVEDATMPTPRLCDEDLVAEKLLANEDRCFDDSAMNRDAIDLIVLEHTMGSLPNIAWSKAREAYGRSVDMAWTRALDRLDEQPDRRARWLDAMGITPGARAVIDAKLAARRASSSAP